jgi:hypothetical protein
MKTPIAFLAKSPHSILPSMLASPKLCGGGPKLGHFNRAKAGS